MKRILCIVLTLVVFLQLFALPAWGAGEYRNWRQNDPRWGDIQFGATDTMTKTGCAVTSIAKLMVHSGAVPDDENQFNPGIYCQWLIDNGGFYQDRGWIVWTVAANYSSKFSYVGPHYLNATDSYESKVAVIESYIKKGNVVVVQVKNGGHYTPVDKVVNGKVLLMDTVGYGFSDLSGYDNSGIDKLHIYKGPHTGLSGGTTTPPTTPTYDTTIDPLQYTITSSDGVNLRSGAGTSYGLTIHPRR